RRRFGRRCVGTRGTVYDDEGPLETIELIGALGNIPQGDGKELIGQDVEVGVVVVHEGAAVLHARGRHRVRVEHPAHAVDHLDGGGRRVLPGHRRRRRRANYGRRRLSSKERIELFSTDEAVRVQRDVEHADYFAGAGVDEHLVLDGQRIQPGRHLPGQSRRLGGIGDELRFGDVETALGSRLNDADGAGCPNDRARIEIGYRIQVRLVAVDDHRRLTDAVETHLDPAAIYRDPGEGLTERDVPRVSAFHDPLDAQVLIRA